jgi:hypothetical protein
MTGMFKVSNPSEARGNDIRAREILDKSAKDIDKGLHLLTAWSSKRHSLEWVWKKTVYSDGRLTDEQIPFCANTGLVSSKRGSLTINDVLLDLASALRLSPHMDLGSFEQPLLNYLFVTSGKRYSSPI